MVLYEEWTSSSLGKGGYAREATREGIKKPQPPEEELQDAAVQLGGGERGVQNDPVTLSRRNVLLLPE